MTGQTDGGLYALLRKNVPGHWVRVESGWTSTGVPDAEYCLPGGAQGWLELKAEHGANRVVVRTLQAAFAEARAARGGRVTLAVKLFNRDVALYDGRALRTLLLDPRSTPVRGGKSCRLEAALPHLLYEGRDWRAVPRILSR